MREKSNFGKPKLKKGDYGYRNYHKKVQLCYVLFGFFMIAAQLFAKYFVNNDWKNILTVMAILSVLPTANLASPLLASWIYKTGSKEVYDKIQKKTSGQIVLYDLIITSKQFIMPVEAAVIHPSGIYLYTNSQKISVPQMEKFINEMLDGHRLDPNAKIIKDEKSFLNRVSSLKSEYEEDERLPFVVQLLKNISM